ncbi:hypothetical protein WJX79_009990 [Trebouxia sp. C0005]
MGKSKSVPDLASKAMVFWTSEDVKQWLKEHESLNKYTKQLKGTTGKELMKLTDDILTQIGIKNPLHRMQLINTRDDLIAQQEQDTAVKDTDSPIMSKPASPTPSFVTPQHSPKGKGPILMKSFSRSQMNGTSNSSSSGFSFGDTSLRRSKEGNMVVLDDDGLSVVPMKGVQGKAISLVEVITEAYGLWKQAYYNASNCEALVSCAAELQGLVLANTSLAARPTLMANLLEAVTEVKEFIATFSERGWLSRLEKVSSDKEEFCRLDRLLISVAVEGGNQPGPEQEYTDDTAELRKQLDALGGMAALQDPETQLLALPDLEQFVSARARAVLASLVAQEVAWRQSSLQTGPHQVIRNPEVRLWWWRSFGSALLQTYGSLGTEEITWERFWSSFPKGLEDETASSVAQVIYNKHTKELFQAAISRGNPNLVTPVELEFSLPRNINLAQQCQILLNWENSYKTLSRSAGRMGSGPRSTGSTLSAVAEEYRPVVNTLPEVTQLLLGQERHCQGLLDALQPDQGQGVPQVVSLCGAPGAGKVNIAVMAAETLFSSTLWCNAYFADMERVETGVECAFQFMAAFAVTADTSDTCNLMSWIGRWSAYPIGLIVHCPPDMTARLLKHVTHNVEKMIKTHPLLQVVLCASEPINIPGIDCVTYELEDLGVDNVAQILTSIAPQIGDRAQELAEACGGRPLAAHMVGTALASGTAQLEEVLQAVASPAVAHLHPLDRCIRYIVSTLPDEFLHALLLLSLFPGSFERRAAAELLGMTSTALSKTRSLLRILTTCNLLQYSSTSERYIMHASVRACCRSLARELGLTYESARVTFIEYYTKYLAKAAALLAAQAPVSAMRLFDREHQNIHEIVRWASQGPPEEALPFYSDILWESMPLLSGRLDLLQREVFCKAVYEQAVEQKDRVAQGRALWQLGSVLGDQGQFKNAEVPLRDALAILESELGSDHLDIAKACNGLAVVLFRLHQYQGAQDLYARAYDIQSSKLGPEDKEVATTMNNTAGLLKAMGKLADAEVVYRTVLDIREKELGPDHVDVAASLNNIAVLLKTSGQFEEAEEMYTRSIAIKEKALGPNHPQVALSLNNLAALLRKMSKGEQAEKLYMRSLSIREEALGPDHPQVAASYVNLAGLLKSENRLMEALPYFNKALDIRERAYGPDHPDVSAAQISLAELLKDLGKFEEAERLCRSAINILEKSVGEDDVNVAAALSLQATCLQGLGKATEAEPLCRRALNIREQAYGAESPNVATALTALADVLKEMSSFEEAEALARRSLVIRERSFGSDDPLTATSLNNLALLLKDANHLEEAETMCRKCIDIRQRVLGESSLEVATTWLNLGGVLRAAGKLEEAESACRQCLDIRERQLGSQHTDTAAAQIGIGAVLLKQGRVDEAKTILSKAATLTFVKLGERHQQSLDAMNWLAECKSCQRNMG